MLCAFMCLCAGSGVFPTGTRAESPAGHLQATRACPPAQQISGRCPLCLQAGSQVSVDGVGRARGVVSRRRT